MRLMRMAPKAFVSPSLLPACKSVDMCLGYLGHLSQGGFREQGRGGKGAGVLPCVAVGGRARTVIREDQDCKFLDRG